MYKCTCTCTCTHVHDVPATTCVYVACNHSSGACFSRVRPTPLAGPRLVAHSQSALDLLGISPDQVRELPITIDAEYPSVDKYHAHVILFEKLCHAFGMLITYFRIHSTHM